MARQRIEDIKNTKGYEDISSNKCFEEERLMFGPLLERYRGQYKTEEWVIKKAEVKKIVDLLTKNVSAKAGSTPAGFTYLGQMLTHELIESTVKTAHDRKEVSPVLNLDSVYPDFDSAVTLGYLKHDSAEFILGTASSSEDHENDLYRPTHLGGRPLIPERRNDENVLVSQLHLLWLKVHNEAVRWLVKFDKQVSRENQYKFSKTFTTLLFQRVVIDEYLRTVLHPNIYDLYFFKERIFFYNDIDLETFKIPLEFSMAMFRFGHTMILDSYQLKKKSGSRKIPLGVLLETGKPVSPEHTIEWQIFFEIDETTPQMAGTLNLILTEQVGGAGGSSAAMAKSTDNPPVYVEISNADKAARERFENGAKGLILKDLMASAEVPTGGVLLDLMELANKDIPRITSGESDAELYNRLKISSPSIFREIIKFKEKDWQKITVEGLSGTQAMTIDNIPLWLFSLLESSILPFEDGFGKSCNRLPQPNDDRLGPITSMVIAEVLNQSIRLAPDNIYQSTTDFSLNMGPLSHVYKKLACQPRGVTMADVFNFQNQS